MKIKYESRDGRIRELSPRSLKPLLPSWRWVVKMKYPIAGLIGASVLFLGIDNLILIAVGGASAIGVVHLLSQEAGKG